LSQKITMTIQLLSCGAAKPDRRAISRMLEEVAGMDNYDATESTGILLDGDPVEIEVSDKKTSSAFRSIRKLDIDYEILD